MAVQAPLHLQRHVLVHQRHLVDTAMAALAAYPFVDMDAVIEIDEVRKIMNTCPLDRDAVAIARAHRLEHLRIGPDLRMAAHTGLGRGKPRKPVLLDRCMAVATVDPQTTHMMLMAEWHRLIADNALLRHIRRAVDLGNEPQQAHDDEQRTEYGDPRKGVGAGMEDLRHQAP